VTCSGARWAPALGNCPARISAGHEPKRVIGLGGWRGEPRLKVGHVLGQSHREPALSSAVIVGVRQLKQCDRGAKPDLLRAEP